MLEQAPCFSSQAGLAEAYGYHVHGDMCDTWASDRLLATPPEISNRRLGAAHKAIAS